MKILIDTHTHTVSSGHAFSTLKENIDYAKEMGLKGIGVTDHGPAMIGGANKLYFLNQKALPRKSNGITIYRGVELNILDEEGNIDLGGRFLKSVDYGIASLHLDCIIIREKSRITKAITNAMKHKKVKIIGHLCDPRLPFDMEEVLNMAKKEGVAIEINNASLDPNMKRYNKEDYLKLIKMCNEKGVSVVIASDSHYCENIGKVDRAIELVKESKIDEKLILNLDIKRFNKFMEIDL